VDVDDLRDLVQTLLASAGSVAATADNSRQR
jgi:hypothetical protein